MYMYSTVHNCVTICCRWAGALVTGLRVEFVGRKVEIWVDTQLARAQRQFIPDCVILTRAYIDRCKRRYYPNPWVDVEGYPE